MNPASAARTYFTPSAVAVAVALTVAAPLAFADNGMPGAGLVVRNQGNVQVNTVNLPGTNQIIGLNNGDTIQNTAGASATVIQWGSPGVVDSANKAGFNVAAGKTLNFTSVTAGSAFLNIDISGNLSSIAGKIVADGNSALAIANAKGITIASGATIVAPVGLLVTGSNMNTIDAINSFDVPTNTAKLNFAAGAPVTVQGDLSGVATYLVVAGSDSVNLSPAKAPAAGVPIAVVGGVGSSVNWTTGAVTLSDNGAPDQTAVFSSAKADVTLGLGSSKTAQDGTKLSVWANGNLTNNGVIDFGAAGPSATNNFQWTGLLTNTGTLETTAKATGLNLDVNGSTVSFYNNGTSQPAFGSFNNSGTIQAVDGYADVEGNQGDMTNSGTILGGNGYVDFATSNGNVTNSGTLHAAQTGGVYVYAGSNDDNTKPHDVTNSGTITSDKGGVYIYSEFGNITNAKTGTISAATSIYIAPNSDGNGKFGSFTNAGSLAVTGPSGSVYIWNDGPGDQTIGGTVGATGTGALTFFSAVHNAGPVSQSGGTTTINTPINVLHDKVNGDGIYIGAQNIAINSPMTVSELNAGAGAGSIQFFGASSNTLNSVSVNANLTAGGFFSSVTNHGTNFTFSPFSQDWAVNGNLTTTNGGTQHIELHDVGNFQGPGVLTANKVLIEGYGNFNNPVSNDFLLNGLHITTVGGDPVVTITARGPGPQAVNLNITGDVTVTSGDTVSDTINAGGGYLGCFNTPLCNYVTEPNAGSSLIAQASGTLTIGPNNYPTALNMQQQEVPPADVTALQITLGPVPSGVSNSNGFLFPGALAFITPGTLNVNTTVDNAYGGTVAPFQGQWYQGTTINALQPLYTNGNARINFSVHPNGSPVLPSVFTATVTHDLFGFSHLKPTLNPDATFLNTYTIIEQAYVHGQDWISLINNTPIH
jgi:filamentous hemagglutinin family protein